MSKYKFIKVRDDDNKFDNFSLEMEVDACTLPDLLESFEYFLRGSGFHFEGELVIEDQEDESTEGDSNEI